MTEDERNQLRTELIKDISITGMIAQLRGKQYRYLVEAHMRKLGKKLPASIVVSVETLTPAERNASEVIIDRFNERGYDPAFWSSDAGDVLISVSQELDLALFPDRADEAGIFNLFHLITLNFAWMAHEQKGLRKSIGIRRGWFV